MKNNNVETIGVKLAFGEQMRRFPLAKGTSFNSLYDQIVSLLELKGENDIVIKYKDEEDDLITISSDLELDSALVDGQLLRLVVSYRNQAKPVELPNAPVAPVVVSAPQLPSVGEASDLRRCNSNWRVQREKMAPGEWIKLKEERKQARLLAKETRGRGRWAKWGEGSEDPKPDRLVARFVKDVTIEDGAQIAPGAAFVKTWRIRNEGAVWPAGCGLRLLGKHGDNLGSPEFVPVPLDTPIAPNQEFDISANLVAPTKPGRYSGYWKMSTADGRKFGQRVWVSIVVPAISSSSEEDRVADKYEALVDVVLAKGVTTRRHRVFRLLQKFDGDVEKVIQVLAQKDERREACRAKRAQNQN